MITVIVVRKELLLRSITVVAVLSSPSRVHAEHRMAVEGGLGLTIPSVAEQPGEPKVEGRGVGGYGEASYYYHFSRWVRPTVYSGLQVTSPQDNCGESPCDVSAQFLFAGAQVRLSAPIPYVAPFVELGVGGSLGRFSTLSGTRVEKSITGVTYHIPISLGVMFGAAHQFGIRLRYLFHPVAQQVSGGFGIGFDFPLEKREQESRPRVNPPRTRLLRPPGWRPHAPEE